MRIILPSRQAPLVRLNRILTGKAYNDARFFLLVDENTFQCCLPRLASEMKSLTDFDFFEVPTGEACKEMDIATRLWETLLENDADSHTVLVNLGGGCVSDIGGFVAAGYKRGIRYINVPTTVVGMIDASIGGKTAVNLAGSKNQVGFFYPPEIVCIEPAFLETLPAEELHSGLCEMLKTFAIGSVDDYRQLCDMIMRDDVRLSNEMIARCVDIKSAIVNADPYDKGLRHILNLGHTFGHAIESYSRTHGATVYSHGTAVGIGMVAAMFLSEHKLGLKVEVLEDYRKVISHLTSLPRYTLRDTEALLALMRKDKKNRAGNIHCVLLQDLGAPVIDLPVDENEIRTALLRIRQ